MILEWCNHIYGATLQGIIQAFIDLFTFVSGDVEGSLCDEHVQLSPVVGEEKEHSSLSVAQTTRTLPLRPSRKFLSP